MALSVWRLGYGLDDLAGRSKKFPLLHSVETGSGAHPVSYTVATWGSFPQGYSF
jgi:hypothetical protein